MKSISHLIQELQNAILAQQQQDAFSIRPPDPQLEQETAKLLARFAAVRGLPFYYPALSQGQGQGPFMRLCDGSVKYDLIGSMGVNLFGHAHPLMIEANLEAALCDTMFTGNLLAYQDTQLFMEELVATVSAKSPLRHCFFTTSGGFANDLALKMIWQKHAPHYKVIALHNGFAGRSVAMQEITDKAAYRDQMPCYLDIDYLHNYQSELSLEANINRALSRLDQIWEQSKQGCCVLLLELVQGEAGFIFGPAEFYHAICQWAREHAITIWFDEVQTFARTHELFAFQMFGLDAFADIVTLGKTLHTCAILFRPELNPRPGLIGGTTNGVLAAIKFGRKALAHLIAPQNHYYGPQGKMRKLECDMKERFGQLAQTSLRSTLTYWGGVGSMISFSLYQADLAQMQKLSQILFQEGIICYTGGGGKSPARIRLLLPLPLMEQNHALDEIFTIIEKSVLRLTTCD